MTELKKIRWASVELFKFMPHDHDRDDIHYLMDAFRYYGFAYKTLGTEEATGKPETKDWTDFIGFSFTGSNNIVDNIELFYKCRNEKKLDEELMSIYITKVENMYRYIFDKQMPIEMSQAIMEHRPFDMPYNMIGSCKIRINHSREVTPNEIVISMLIDRHE